MSTAKPDYDAALAFLRTAARRVHLVAINPNQRGQIRGKLFLADGTQRFDEIRAFIEEWNTRKHWNVYFTTGTVRRDLDCTVKPKARDTDIEVVTMFKVDLDPSKDIPDDWTGTPEEFVERQRVRILASLTSELPEGVVGPPTIVLDSGGGLWGLWLFGLQYDIENEAERPLMVARNKHLIELYRAHFRDGGVIADGVADLSRICRLPGTVNFPDKDKAAAGRTPRVAKVVEDASDLERRYAPNLFDPPEGMTAAPSSNGVTVTIDAANVKRFASVDDIPELRDESDARNAKCRVAIVQGRDPDDSPKTRSQPLLFVCCQMVRAGCSDDAIYSVITDPSFGISVSVLDKGSGIERYATRQVEEARKKVAAEAEEFQKDKDGKPYKSLHNARVAVRKLGVTLEFDEFAERSLIAGLPGFGPQLDDAAVTRMRLDVEERFRIPFGKDWFADFIADAARRNRRHPVREFLDGLTWDKTPRLDGWMTTFLGVKNTDYTRAIGTLVLVAAVRRIRKPGCKFDEMLVLEGEQGSLKSTALKVLAVVEDWFSDDLPLNAKSQQFIEQTVGKWIVEAGELKGMRKGDIESLKSCLSRSLDRARMAYGRLAIERPRQFVIIGTTNSERYLKDSTGNRRFWPVRVGEVRLAELRRDREQLWAEAAAREAAGVSIRLDPALYDAARAAQEERRVEDPWVQVIDDILGDLEGKLRTADTWLLVGVSRDRRTQQDNERLGEVMRELGWERVKLRFGGDPEWAYARGNESARRRAILPVWEEERPGVRALRFRLEDEPVLPPPTDEQADVVFGQEGTATRREER